MLPLGREEMESNWVHKNLSISGVPPKPGHVPQKEDFHGQYRPRIFHQMQPNTVQIVPFMSAIAKPTLNTSLSSTKPPVPTNRQTHKQISHVRMEDIIVWIQRCFSYGPIPPLADILARGFHTLIKNADTSSPLQPTWDLTIHLFSRLSVLTGTRSLSHRCGVSQFIPFWSSACL